MKGCAYHRGGFAIQTRRLAQDAVNDLSRAAAARGEALRTSGPARRGRLRRSKAALEQLAAQLPDDLRAGAIELAGCTDPAEAVRLADELTSGALAAAPEAPPETTPEQKEPRAPARVLKWVGD